MRKELEIIAENAKELAEIATCDTECHGDDFCEDDYRKRIAAMTKALDAIKERRIHAYEERLSEWEEKHEQIVSMMRKEI